jgi:DNA-binding GntR family transcriptional regulator
MAWEDRSARISRDDPRLLSEQVADDIRAGIKSGHYKGRLPGEDELSAEIYGVSRGTIRRAIKLLVDEGTVIIQHGRGTFIKPQGK